MGDTNNGMTMLSAASNIGGQIMDGINRRGQERRNFRYQRRLMGHQQENQMALNRQGHDLSYEMWKKTNYPAQVEMMKEAGLNQGLMYGSGGGAGGTTQSGSGGGAGGGNVGMSNIGGSQGIGMLERSQIALNKSQETKNIAEADDIRGGEGTQGEAKINKLNAEIQNADADTALKKTQELVAQKDINVKEAQTALLKSQDFKTQMEGAIKELEKDRGEEGFLQGQYVGNIISGIFGLNMNNPDDRLKAQLVVGTMIGAKIAGDISGALGGFLSKLTK